MEKYLPVVGYEGLYEVSDHGNVRSIFGRWSTGGLLKKSKIRNGYEQVTLWKNKKYISKTVHRLVAISHIPNPENKKCVNHIDGNTSNNNTTNLEWCTHSENTLHKFHILGYKNSQKQREWARKLGLSTKDKGLSVLQYSKSKELIKEWSCMKNASKKTGTNYTNLVECANNNRKSAGGFIWSKIPLC